MLSSLLRAGIGARVFAFLCICLLLGTGVGVWALGRYARVADEIAHDMALRSTDLAESLKSQVIRNAYMTLKAMSGFQRVQGKNPEDCSNVAYFFLMNTNGYVNTGSILPDGEIYCAAQPSSLQVNASELPWFKDAMHHGEFTMGGYDHSPITNSEVVIFALPLKDEDNNITQVLSLTADMRYIKKVLDFPQLPDDTTLIVIDQHGIVLIGGEGSGVNPGENIAGWNVARQAMTADAPFIIESKGPDGTDRIFAATSSRINDTAIPGASRTDIRGFSILVGIPARRITATIMAPVQMAGIAIGISFTIILIIIYFFVSRTLIIPIREIQMMAERLTFGDLTARVPKRNRAGEIRTLANAFNIMAATLAKREDDIRTSNTRFERIFETEPAGISLLDTDLRVININKAGLENIGADSLAQVIGKRLPMLVIEEDREKYLKHLRNVRNGLTDQVLVQIVDLKGKKRWLDMQSANIQFDDSTTRNYISIARNKTQEIATSEQLVQAQKMESIGRLTGGVAHDFNNLLTIVMGNAEILREDLEDRPKLQRLAAMIESAAQRGAELTHRMLAFARRQVLRPAELDTNALLTRMIDMMGRLLGEDIRILMETSDDLWRVAADPAQMEAAILNLAINSRDAMPKGGTLTIETRNVTLDDDYVATNPEATAGDFVLIAVSDSGTGMTPEVLAHVFDPFFTTKEVGKGSGLGLSMVYGFVKQSHGHIKIYSEVSYGTTVRIYLPKISDEIELDSPELELSITEARGTETILVTEDEDSVRAYVTEQLRSLGYTVLETTNAAAALAILEERSDIDLLFTDVVLPGGMNGRQLADLALTKFPTLKVLYTTGYTENAVVHHGKLDVGVELLSKPYRRADLARHIRKVLDKT
ncbi:MAG: ATP-binding protein [Parvibaculum sp.]|nr:ATP-binding protein [Parvibaculum sp.]